MNDWTSVEFFNIQLGDKRLDKRALKILKALGDQPEQSIPQCFHSRAETQACYRFFSNNLVNHDKIIAPHYQASITRIGEHPVVLIPSDTTTLNFTGRNALKESGYISSNMAQGFFLHASIAITPERLALGVIGSKIWGREKEKVAKKHRDLRPIEEKESVRWIESYRLSCSIAKECDQTTIVNIVDREGDFYELLLEVQTQRSVSENAAHIIVRSQYNRSLETSESQPFKSLHERLEQTKELGRISFILPGRDGNEDRRVTQSYRAKEVVIKARRKVGAAVEDIKLNAVLLDEVDPPEGVAPIRWILLTTLPVGTLQQAQTVIRYYLCRWEIEVFFKTYKSGCKVEERQLQSADRLYPLFTVFLLIAWRVHYLTNIGRVFPEEPCTLVFEDAEWKAGYMAATRKRVLPETTPTLKEMIGFVGMLGGYLNRKNDPPPGTKALWKGITRLKDYADAWDIFGPESDTQKEKSVKKTYA